MFAATAALGAGLEVAANTLRHGNSVPASSAAFVVAIPVAVYLVLVDRLHAYMNPEAAPEPGAAVVSAALVLLCAASVAIVPLAAAVAAMAICLAGHITCNTISAQHRELRDVAQKRSAQDAGVAQ